MEPKKNLSNSQIMDVLDQDLEALIQTSQPRLELVNSGISVTPPGHLEDFDVASNELESEEDAIENYSPLLSDFSSDDEVSIIGSFPSGSGSTPAKIPKLNPTGKGRKMDPSWEHFRTKPNEKTKVECIHCKAVVSSKVERLRAHLTKCEKTGTVSGSKISVAVAGTSQSNSLKRKQPVITKYVDRVSKSENTEIHREIAKYIYSANLPFSHVETPAFVRLWNKMRPGVKLPNRFAIAGPLLNQTYDEVVNELKSELDGKTVTIIQDGWKSRTNEPIIAHCISTGGKAYLLNAKSAEENKKTGEYCASLLLEAIDQATVMFGVTVKAVVTDNCSSMRKMRKIMEKEKKGMLTYGCHSHLLNLIGKYITPEETKEKVEEVNIYFRRHDAASSLLKKRNGIRPLLASSTRWNSWIECFESYLKNQTKYLDISRMPSSNMQGEEAIIDILNDKDMYDLVKKTVDIMKPIQVALDKLQAETATLADGVHCWLRLRDELSFRDLEEQEYFEKQFKRAVTEVACAAYMLHPTYRGEGLSPNLISQGQDLLAKKGPFYLIIAAQLQQRNPKYFPEKFFSPEILSKCNPVDWWNSQQCLEKLEPGAIKFASELMTLPAGSADIERHFSALGNILNVRRCRLGIEKATKLCIIYKYYSGIANVEDVEDYSDI